MRLPNRPIFENSLMLHRTICTLIKTVQSLSYSARGSKKLFAIDVFFSLEIELQFELKISVLGQKVEFYPTKCVGDLDWTPIGDGNS